MKNLIRLFILWGIIAGFLTSCRHVIIDPQEIGGKLISNSDCKFMKSAEGMDYIADTFSCIEYSYNSSEKVLSVTHINAGFNCCPGKITCDVSAQENVITIKEYEEVAACDCNCLFDLEISVTGVEKQIYRLVIEEPYAEGQTELNQEIDLKDQEQGSFCVVRKDYPWGVYSMYGE